MIPLTCSKQSQDSETENTANDPLEVAAARALGFAAPGPLPRLILPMFMSSSLSLLQENRHGVLVHIRMFAWR